MDNCLIERGLGTICNDKYSTSEESLEKNESVTINKPS